MKPEGMVLRFCPHCGKPGEENKPFCTDCGTLLPQSGSIPSAQDPVLVLGATRSAAPARSGQTIIFLGIGIGMIVLIAIAVFLILPKLSGPIIPPSPGTPAQTDPAAETPRATFVIPKETLPMAVPASGVWVHIIYLGSWNASYGMPGQLQATENSGERYLEIPNAGGRVAVNAVKRDGSANHSLIAEIFRDGISLVNGSTLAAYGNVSLSADTGLPPLPREQITPGVTENTSLTAPALPAANTSATTPSAGRTPAPVTAAPICPSDRIACNGMCTDPLTNNSHCGYCDNSCPNGKYCLNGLCAISCSAEQTSCPDGCFNLMTDPKHCGTCGNSCPNGLVCTLARCDSPATPMPVPQ
jgi:hypothetical protein